jgi:hypothetical protein
VDTSNFQPEVALMLLRTSIIDAFTLYNPTRDTSRGIPGTIRDSENLDVNEQQAEKGSSTAVQVVTHEPSLHAIDVNRYANRENKPCILLPGQSLSCGLGVSKNALFPMMLSAKEIKKWSQAAVALHQDPASYPIGFTLQLPRQCLQQRSLNYPKVMEYRLNRGQKMFERRENAIIFMSIFLSIVYGLVHLTARTLVFRPRWNRVYGRHPA